MKKQTIAVLGLGLFGTAVARELAENGADVIALDLNMEHVEEVIDVVEHAVQADFTKIEQLVAAGVDTCDIAIIATGEKLEITILGIMNLKKLGIKEVVVKTKNFTYQEVLQKVGADRVVLPEVEMGVRLAHELVSTDVLDLIRLDDQYHVIEMHVLPEWVGKSIEELNVREKHGINIIAMRQTGSKQLNITIKPDYIVQESDIIIALSEDEFVVKSKKL